MSAALRAEAQVLLEALRTTPFEDCCYLSREFESVPSAPGFYAFRHRMDGILYIGIANNLRRRFRNGHKALAWAFIDHIYADDVRIALVAMGERTIEQVDYLETLMIQSARPRYNTRMT
jgi:excinuclease UvrABC nuclease subunit